MFWKNELEYFNLIVNYDSLFLIFIFLLLKSEFCGSQVEESPTRSIWIILFLLLCFVNSLD